MQIQIKFNKIGVCSRETLTYKQFRLLSSYFLEFNFDIIIFIIIFLMATIHVCGSHFQKILKVLIVAIVDSMKTKAFN